MPNHIENRITLNKEVLDKYTNKDGDIDFNLIIPQPEELLVGDTSSRVIDVAKLIMGKIDLNPGEPANGRGEAFKNGDYQSLTNILQAGTIHRMLTEQDLANNFDDGDFESFILCLRSIRATGSPSWYEWNVASWGTKWGAYEQRRTGDTVICFQTAWSAPHKVIAEIFKNHNCEILHEWADEDTGSNVGVVKYSPDNEPLVEDLSNEKEGYELCFELHGGQPDYYKFNEKLGTYEYVDEED